MAQVPVPSLISQHPWTARLVLAGAAALVLTSGALNLRPLASTLLAGEQAAPTSSTSSVPETALDRSITALQDALRDGDPLTQSRNAAQLGHAYLQKARETGDSSYYPKAETLFTQSLAGDASNVDALAGMGTLALARHEFRDARQWGERAVVAAPQHAAGYGVLVDAQVELGEYEAATDTLQHMVDLRPDLGSLSRISYLRELMGDRAGAISAMQRAVTAGSGYPENVAWAQAQLGNLCFDGGDLTGAAEAYEAASAAVPAYAPAMAGEAKVLAARGQLVAAAGIYAEVAALLPLPEYLTAYGDVLSARGDHSGAEAQFATVAAIQQLQAANGVNTDLELALFIADHGDADAVRHAAAQAKAAVAVRPSVTAYDALAWTLYRAGDLDAAADASDRALRLSTQSAAMHFHAGMIASARGDTASAITHLRTALTLNPYFSLRYAPVAQAELARLQNEAAS
jgi:tetratricopeptide (TPR) repeat protein